MMVNNDMCLLYNKKSKRGNLFTLLAFRSLIHKMAVCVIFCNMKYLKECTFQKP